MSQKEIFVIGDQEFNLGFRLAGIRKIITPENLNEEIDNLLQSKEAGIVILDEKIMENLEERKREDLVASVDPVFVVVSTEAKQDELRKMIIQSIGVDLMKEG